MDSRTFLERAPRLKPQPIYVVFGDEDFLRRQTLAAIRTLVLGPEADSFGLTALAGDRTTFSQVRSELDTLPFLAARRLVVIEQADPFVTAYRAALENYVANPSPTGVLVLDVKSWPANTRLAKLISADSAIDCKSPQAQRVPDWCVQRAQSRYEKQLSSQAARLLVDLVGPDMGLLDQELNKLAIYVDTAKRIDAADVDKLVGQSRNENTWKIFDAIGNNQPREALALLDRVLEQGDDPHRILAAFSMQLRRLAQASRLARHGQPLSTALQEVGIPPFAIKGSEQQLRHLGQERVGQLYDWLIKMDLDLKGGSQLPPRTLLERLVVRLAVKA